ncbi:Peptidase inhibitor 16 [Bulinus truncatus]|nr:Peptidase inhibitor 16 [Bulinus truncatus]
MRGEANDTRMLRADKMLAAIIICGLVVLVNFSIGRDISDTSAGDNIDGGSGPLAAHSVFKRQANTSGFTADQLQIIVDRHNLLRANESSSDMVYVTWNTVIAQNAQNYAERCNYSHSLEHDRTNLANYSLVGENMFTTTGSLDEKGFVNYWYSEKQDYNYNTHTCNPSKACGHYTQVVWANTKQIGCGYKFCPVLETLNWTNAYLVVCQYGPTGNYQDEYPYAKGSACSMCPANYTHCRDKLCATSTAPTVIWPAGHFVLYVTAIATSLSWFNKEHFLTSLCV